MARYARVVNVDRDDQGDAGSGTEVRSLVFARRDRATPSEGYFTKQSSIGISLVDKDSDG